MKIKCIVLLFFSGILVGENERSFLPRGLIIFLHDPQEKCVLEAIDSTLVTALLQDAGPIVVSANLLKSILGLYVKEPAPQQKTGMMAKMLSRITPSFQVAMTQLNPCKRLMTQPDLFKKWIIKEVNRDLYLMLPLSHIAALGIDAAKVDSQSDAVTDVELTLGLKVNHMRTLSVETIAREPFIPTPDASYFVEALEKGKLFCARTDYQNKPQPLWTWYITGHGAMNNSIVRLRLPAFKKMLDTTAQLINMRLLMYVSCYAAGTNQELIYRNEKSLLPTIYPFALATQSIADTRIFFDSDRFKFDEFIKLPHLPDIPYKEIIGTLFHITPDSNYIGSIAQIKLPGLEWFSPLADRKDVANIGGVMAQSRTKPLDMQKYFKGNPKALLIETNSVPFKIILNTPHLEYIVSTWVPLPNHAMYIQAISSRIYTLYQILDLFMKVDRSTTFYIAQIFCLDSTGRIQEYKDILITPSWTCYTNKLSGRIYKQFVGDEPFEAPYADAMHYKKTVGGFAATLKRN